MNGNEIQQSEPMKWVRKKSTLHVAEGQEGIFYIEESRRYGVRRFWPKYRSKTGGKNFNMPPSGSLFLAKLAVEESAYWEDGRIPDNTKADKPQHAAAPKAEVKRWDMKY